MIILASNSPRRREILSLLDVDFTVVLPKDEPKPDLSLSPAAAVERIARFKAESVAEGNETVVIGADTAVFLDGEFLGKPKDENDAAKMLKKLSGRTHSVITGVCIVHKGRTVCFSVRAVLTEQIFVGTRKTVKVISGIFPSRLPQYPAKICPLKPLGVRLSYAYGRRLRHTGARCKVCKEKHSRFFINFGHKIKFFLNQKFFIRAKTEKTRWYGHFQVNVKLLIYGKKRLHMLCIYFAFFVVNTTRLFVRRG